MSNARIVMWIIRLWLVVALFAGASGRLTAMLPPVPQIVLLALTVLAIAATLLVPRVRGWADTVDLRVLVGFHLLRFVGVYFLLLYQRGELPYAFAVLGGIGDIVVATLALLILASGQKPGASRFFLWWNVVGFIDIFFVVGTAARLAMADPASMSALLRLPLSLLPTWLVPLIIASHVLIFRRLLRGGATAPAAT
jgi:hypothetical protein